MLNLIYKPIKDDLEKVQGLILEQLSSRIDGEEFPSDIARHLFLSRGKLLRPALVLFSSRIGEHYLQNRDKIIKLAASIELIHTATLIHDDIIDGATLRRNSSTLNLRYGNDISVIIGDYLYAKAFYLLAGIGSTYILKVLAHTAQKMCAGELNECKDRNVLHMQAQDYLALIEQKTASLISDCCHLGCFLARTPKKYLEVLSRYGTNIGMAFQITDDCLDFIGDEKTMGKAPGSDIKNGKLTLPMIILLKTMPLVERNKIIDAMKDGSNMSGIIKLVKTKGTVDEAYKEAFKFACLAKENLSQLDGFILKKNLSLLTDYVIKRRG